MKYSILIPYYRRLGHLHNTLVSFSYHYGNRMDYEVILVEDYKDVVSKDNHQRLLDTVEHFRQFLPITHIMMSMYTWNPVSAFNTAVKWATGKYFVITNPECFHYVNILAGLDEEFEMDPDVYIVCACRNWKGCSLFISSFSDFAGTEAEWYQHSVHRNADFHFCTALSGKNFEKVGGFDEEYGQGIAYDDADFRNRVRAAKIPFRVRDDLLTVHIDHGSFPSPKNASELIQRNREIFQRKWG